MIPLMVVMVDDYISNYIIIIIIYADESDLYNIKYIYADLYNRYYNSYALIIS
jgi:hypothetical protein